MKNTFLISLVLILLLASCKKENLTTTDNNNPPVDLYQENLKLVDTTADFYFVADVEGISGVNKIIIQKGVNNANLHVPSYCELPSDLYRLTFSNSQWSLVISLWDSIFDGTYDLNCNEHKPFYVSASNVRNVAGIGLTVPSSENFTCAETGPENASYFLDKTYRNFHLTARFKYCAMKDYPATKTVVLKNAVCKFW
ncbi:MAG: hypothetical protein V4615_12590 [Bacteroidota bacterium]